MRSCVFFLALAACDFGHEPPCQVVARQVLLEGSEQALFRTVGDTIQVQTYFIVGELLTPMVVEYDRLGNELARRLDVPRRFGLPSDRAFVADGAASVFVVRELFELPPETFTTPQGEVTLKPIVPQDRLWFSFGSASPFELPLVTCDKCFVRTLALRAIGGSLVVMWQLSNDDVLQLAQLDYQGRVLTRRTIDSPGIAGLAFQRFRSTPQSDLAAVATTGSLVLLIDEALQTVREDLSQYDIVAWSDARLLVASSSINGDLLASASALLDPIGSPTRYSTDFLPTVAGLSEHGAGIVGYAGNVPYLVVIDANGNKLGGDVLLDDIQASATSPVDGLLVVGDRSYSLFQQHEGTVERVQVDCR